MFGEGHVPVPSGEAAPIERSSIFAVMRNDCQYAICLAAIILCMILSFYGGSKSRLQVPGPKGIPLFGNLLDVRRLPLHILEQYEYAKVLSYYSCTKEMPKSSANGPSNIKIYFVFSSERERL